METFGQVIGGTHTKLNQAGKKGLKREGLEQIPADDEDSKLRTWTSAAEFSMKSAFYGNVRVLMLIERVSQIPD